MAKLYIGDYVKEGRPSVWTYLGEFQDETAASTYIDNFIDINPCLFHADFYIETDLGVKGWFRDLNHQ